MERLKHYLSIASDVVLGADNWLRCIPGVGIGFVVVVLLLVF